MKRRAIVISMMLLIALLHVIGIGRYLHGDLRGLYSSYFSDLVLPFGNYFLLCNAELQMPFLRSWQVKWAVMFLIPSICETCQYFGLQVLGATFDPLDYLMYAFGAGLAALVDTQVFARVFDFWTIKI